MDENSNRSHDPDESADHEHHKGEEIAHQWTFTPEGELIDEYDMSQNVHVPFTEEQVRSLNAYQFHGTGHPFTCANENCRGRIHYGPVTSSICLVATTDGWVCGACGYTQDWAWGWMADWTWQEQADALEEWKAKAEAEAEARSDDGGGADE